MTAGRRRPPAPVTRAVASTAVPRARAIITSTGPPGAAWMMTKFTSMIPNSVGTISTTRRPMYASMEPIIAPRFPAPGPGGPDARPGTPGALLDVGISDRL